MKIDIKNGLLTALSAGLVFAQAPDCLAKGHPAPNPAPLEHQAASFSSYHPAPAEVLVHDHGLLKRHSNQDKGDLSSHDGQLKSEDASIPPQEHMDAARNTSHLTGQESSQLNREENGLQRHNKDNHGEGDSQLQANHPSRSQVLDRDASLNNQIN